MVLKCKKFRKNITASILTVLLIADLLMFNSCKLTKISYSFTGASTIGLKTISVQYFQNRASLVQPALSQTLTDALIDKCKSQTNLNIVNGLGDVNFEGEISDYSTKPLTVSADATAASYRFTITVKVKFTNAVNPDNSFEESFSRYVDYSSSTELNQVTEDEYSKEIVDMLVEDIFNRAFVNW